MSKEKARLLYEKAAEQGDPYAQYNLGYMHSNGEGGLPVSKEKALLWLKRAAEQGFEFATTLIDTAFKNKCFSCGNTGTMKCCSRCKCAYYCSQECQAAAWRRRQKRQVSAKGSRGCAEREQGQETGRVGKIDNG